MEGDCNTRYFYSVVNWRKWKTVLRGINVDGCWVKEPLSNIIMLVANFDEGKVKEVVLDCGNMKCPGRWDQLQIHQAILAFVEG